MSSSTVAFLSISAFLCLSVSLSVSDSDSFSGSPHPLRVSLFLFHSLSPCFSWDVPVCLLFCLFRCLSVLPYFLFLFLPLAACLCLPLLSLLPGLPEHHQLPDPEAPCPGEHTPAHLLGTSRYRDLQVRRPPFSGPEGTRGLETESSCLGCRRVDGLNEGREGRLPSLGPRELRCHELGRTEAAGLDSESCGRPSPYPVL